MAVRVSSQTVSVALALMIAAITVTASFVYAQGADISYPVAELGDCENKKACKTYCDNLAHIEECVTFALGHGLMDEEEAAHARAFAKAGGTGPGGCTSKQSCENYCENVAHIRECLAFADEHDVIPPEELEEARRVAQALEAGATLPGGCTSKRTCESYCENPSNMRQCLAFAKQAGFMDEKELEEAEKVAAYIESGGQMPGGCGGEKECKAYCENGENMEECAAFALKAGFMSEKEAEMFRKTGGKGPGGCRAKECEAYCQDEAHREECIAFAMEHDLMSAEDKARMEEGKSKAKEALEKAPPEVLTCIEQAIGPEKLAKIRSGEGFVGPELGEVLPRCFQQIMGQDERGGSFGRGVPSEARECMRKVFGDDFEEQMKSGKLDPGAHDSEIRTCMQEQLGEGFLNDDGRWERPERGQQNEGESRDGRAPSERRFIGPPTDDEREQFKSRFKEQFGEKYQARHEEMEAQMRAEIDKQMRSGNFDRSKLPADFRPEGLFPPEEAFRRPPEGTPGGFTGDGMRRSEGMPPPDGMRFEGMRPPEGFEPPPGALPPPPTEQFIPPPQPPAPPAEGSREPVGMRSGMLGNVLSIIENILGTR